MGSVLVQRLMVSACRYQVEEKDQKDGVSARNIFLMVDRYLLLMRALNNC